MVRTLGKKHYQKIVDTMTSLAKPGGVDIVPLIPLRATLPSGFRAVVITLFGVRCVIVSKRLRSENSIREALKHEMIHVAQNDYRHGREFRKACVMMGLDPNKHA